MDMNAKKSRVLLHFLRNHGTYSVHRSVKLTRFPCVCWDQEKAACDVLFDAVQTCSVRVHAMKACWSFIHSNVQKTLSTQSALTGREKTPGKGFILTPV